MSKRQVIILWIIAAVLASLVTIIKVAEKDPTEISTDREPGETLLKSFPAAEVASITISSPSNSVTLDRKDGRWTVKQRDDYPADTPKVNEFLRTMETLEIARAIEAGPSFAPRFGMDPKADSDQDAGITAAFAGSDGGELAKVTLGKNIQTNNANNMFGPSTVGRYIQNHADSSGFYAVSDTLPTITTDPSQWLDPSFFSLEKVKTITLGKQGGSETEWSVSRETEEAEFQLVNAEPGEVANTTGTSPLKSLFSYIRFDDVVPAGSLAERADTSGTRTATIETFEGFIYTLTLTPDKLNAASHLLTLKLDASLPETRKKGENESEEDAATLDKAFDERISTLKEKLAREKAFDGRTYVVSQTSVNPLLKSRAEMVTKPAPEKPAGTTVTSPPIPLKP